VALPIQDLDGSGNEIRGDEKTDLVAARHGLSLPIALVGPAPSFLVVVSNLIHALSYAAMRAVEFFLRLLPLRAVWSLGRALGLLAWALAGGYRALAVHNLRIAFGAQQSEAWIKAQAREHFAALFANLLCGIKLATMPTAAIEACVTVDGSEHLKAAIASGRPVLGLIAHLSCWEVLAQVPSYCSFGRRPGTIFQPLRNPYLNALLLRRRERQGYAVFSRRDGFGGPLAHLRQGDSLGVLMDQHAGDSGLWCPLFGRLASTTPVVAMMALRAKAQLLSLAVYDDGPARWRLVYRPISEADGVTEVPALTAALNRHLEVMIRHQPHAWFWVHSRWKTPRPRFLLGQVKRGIVMPEQGEALQPFEILLRSPNWLGDACMALPAVRAIARGRPDARVTVLGPEKLREFWQAQPEVAAYVGKADGDGPWKVANLLKQTAVKYEVGILFTHSPRSTLEMKLGPVRRLVGFPGKWRRRWLHQVVPEPKVNPRLPLHHAKRYLHLAMRLGAGSDAPELWGAPPAARNPQGQTLRVALCAGAEYGPAKRWPVQRYAQVARELHGRRGDLEFVLVGAPKEAALGAELSAVMGSQLPHCNEVGRTSLAQLIALLQGCHLLITNDTGTMHLAAALGLPTVSVFGSTEPLLTGPLGPQHVVLREQVPCSPCFKRECPFGHYDCLMRIEPALVVEAALRQLDGAA